LTDRYHAASADWRTKPSDRFVLKWIKLHLSARIAPRLVDCRRVTPLLVTMASTALGVVAGVVFALGWPFWGGLTAGVSQVLDGVDGQLARLRGVQTRGGAFWDSVLDRYADGAMVIGLTVCVAREFFWVPLWLVVVVGSLALIGSGQISYTTARAESLSLDLGRPTLASKGTRVSLVVLAGVLSPLIAVAPPLVLLVLAIQANLVVVQRLLRVKSAYLDLESDSREELSP
jgi:phosphatidylglycerophosphate synthase